MFVSDECSVRKESTAINIRFSVKCFRPRNVVVTCDHGINSHLFQEQSGPPVQLFRVPVVRISGNGGKLFHDGIGLLSCKQEAVEFNKGRIAQYPVQEGAPETGAKTFRPVAMEKKYLFIADRNHFWFGMDPESAFSQVAEGPAVVVSCKIEGGAHLFMIPFKIGENLLSQRRDIMFSFHPVVKQIPQNVQPDTFQTAPADQCTQIILNLKLLCLFKSPQMDIRNKKMHDLLLEYNKFLAVLDLLRYGLAGLFLARYNEVYERFKILDSSFCRKGRQERDRSAGKLVHFLFSEGQSIFFIDKRDDPIDIPGRFISFFHQSPDMKLLCSGSVIKRIDQWEGHFSLFNIISLRFSNIRQPIIKKVILYLKSDADIHTDLCHG